MPEEEKAPLRSETFFLPPLKMILSFFDRESRQRNSQVKPDEQQASKERTVEKLIRKLSDTTARQAREKEE
ncbi:MAG TPA: hypothetical protein VNK49_06350 [Anaerolineales bacterium]|nr:hypothetical protein [Anaerolineales bacterium]